MTLKQLSDWEMLVGFLLVCAVLMFASFQIGYNFGFADLFNRSQPRTTDQMCVGKYMGEVIFSSQGRFCKQPDNYTWRLGYG